ncbi:MAG: hypothetical protein AAB343_02125 [Patescibacteria group bacterium]
MPTIFVSCFHPLIGRNIIQTDILPTIVKSGYRIVVFVPHRKRSYFQQAYPYEGVIYEGIQIDALARQRSSFLLKRLFRAMLSIDAARLLHGKQTYSLRYALLVVCFYGPAAVLGKSSLFRRLMRYIDYRIYSVPEIFSKYFQAHQPRAVFATDVFNEFDVALSYAARERGVQVIGMVRSWDNLTRQGRMRSIPNRLLVWNPTLAVQAGRLDDVPAARITVVGIPHYDRYVGRPSLTRENFLISLGLDPKRKTVLFAPMGDIFLHDNPVDQMAFNLLRATGLNIIVRLPPTRKVTIEGLDATPSVYIDQPGVVFRAHEWADREMSKADEDRLIHELAFADVVFPGPSSMLIDAAIYAKPMMLIAFDTSPNLPYKRSIRRYCDSPHVRQILDACGVAIAQTPQDVDAFIANSHTMYDQLVDGVQRIVREQCWRLDGASSRRVAEVLIKYTHE